MFNFSTSFLFSITTLFERIIPLILLPIILNDIGVRDYGLLYLILTIVNFFLPLLSFGFNLFFSKEYSLKDNTIFKSIFSNFLIFQFFLFLFCTTLLSSLISIVFDVQIIDLSIILILALSQVTNQAIKEIFRIRQKIKPFAYIVISIFFIDIIFTLIFLKYLDFGFKSRIYASALAFSVTTVLSIIYLRKHIHIKINKHYLLKWFLFGKKIIIYKISGFLLNKGDRFVIKLLLGDYMLGIYVVATQAASPFLILMTAINSGWNSFIYNHLKLKKFHYSDLKMYFNYILTFLVTCLIAYQYLLEHLISFLTTEISINEIFFIQLFICLAYISQTMYSLHLPIFIS